ncbi:MAG: hypothetical protein QQN39_06905 [Nitrosopumilus sp.]
MSSFLLEKEKTKTFDENINKYSENTKSSIYAAKKSDEKIIRLSNAIGFNTSKKIEVAKIHHDIQTLLDDMKEREK